MVDRTFRALRQSDPVTRETKLMEKAICPPSSLSYIHQSLNSLPASPTSPSPELKIKEIESVRIITDAKRQPDKLISVDKNTNELQLEAIITRDDNNDNKLEAINPWKANLTPETCRIVSGSTGANSLPSLPEEGKRPPLPPDGSLTLGN